jgi:hypothetical protein
MLGVRRLHPVEAMERMRRPLGTWLGQVRCELERAGEEGLLGLLEDAGRADAWMRTAGYELRPVAGWEMWVAAHALPEMKAAAANDLVWRLRLAGVRDVEERLWTPDCWFPDPLLDPYPWDEVGRPPLAVRDQWDRDRAALGTAPPGPPPRAGRPRLVAVG